MRERCDTRASDVFGCATGRSRSLAVRRRFRYRWSARSEVASAGFQQLRASSRVRSTIILPYRQVIPGKKKCAPVAKSISAHFRHSQFPVYSTRNSEEKTTRLPRKSRVDRASTVVVPPWSRFFLGFGNESSEIRKKHGILARGGFSRESRRARPRFRFEPQHVYAISMTFWEITRSIGLAPKISRAETHTWRGYFHGQTTRVQCGDRV